jgi:hypothetical protein
LSWGQYALSLDKESIRNTPTYGKFCDVSFGIVPGLVPDQLPAPLISTKPGHDVFYKIRARCLKETNTKKSAIG